MARRSTCRHLKQRSQLSLLFSDSSSHYDVTIYTGSLIGSQRHAQHLRRRSEVEAPVRFVAIPEPDGLEGAALVSAFFHPQEFALPARCGIAHMEIDAAKES